MEIGYTGFSIDSLPWGEKDSKYVSSTDENLGKIVTVTEENATREYVKTELGWIDKRALVTPEPDRIDVQYEALINVGGFSIDSRPWGEASFRNLDVSDKYIGRTLNVKKENTSGEYALISDSSFINPSDFYISIIN